MLKQTQYVHFRVVLTNQFSEHLCFLILVLKMRALPQLCFCYLLVIESILLCSSEDQTVMILLLIQVFFELMVVKLFFLIPVANFSFSSKSVSNVVIVHLKFSYNLDYSINK